MSSEQPEDTLSPSSQSAGDSKSQSATVLVRGETLHEQQPQQSATDASAGDAGKSEKSNDKEKAAKPISPAKAKLQSRLPALDDDADVGVQTEHIVTRDGKADLAFTGTLVASAAPASAPKGQWQEYRIYETGGGKHVFSKVSRKIYADEQDANEAEIFDPAPSSMPSQLLRSARDLTRSHPVTWQDAAVSFFGYDPLAKELYRKVSGDFEEHIS